MSVKRFSKALFGFLLVITASFLLASSVLAAIVTDVESNSLRVGLDVYSLEDTDNYTYEKVLDSLRYGGSQYYYKLGEYWYDLLDGSICEYDDLIPANAVSPDIVRTWNLRQWYRAGDSIEYFEPIVSTYSFKYGEIDAVTPGEDIDLTVTFSTDLAGAVGYDAVLFAFNADGPGAVTFTPEGNEGASFTDGGVWGAEGGFTIPSDYTTTTTWTLNFAYAGDYTVTFSLVDATNKTVVAEITNQIDITAVRTPEEAKADFLTALETRVAAITAAKASLAGEDISAVFSLNTPSQNIGLFVQNFLDAFSEELLSSSLTIKLDSEELTINTNEEDAVTTVTAYLLGNLTPEQFLTQKTPVFAAYTAQATDKYNVGFELEGDLSLLHQYIVAFNSDGGSTVEGQVVDYGETATAPDDPEKEGYTFAGWFKEQALTTTWIFAEDTVTADITLYALWAPREDTAYTVEHYQQNVSGDGYTLKDTVNLTGTTDEEVTAVAKEYTGFAENTSHADRLASDSIAPDGSLVLKLYYDRNTFTVSFNSNEGSTVGAITGVRYEAAITAPTTPTKTGYTFAGWFKEQTLTNEWVFASDIVTADITLYAKWAPNTDTAYTVEHYQKDLGAEAYTLVTEDTDSLTGTTGQQTAAQANDYTGFTAQAFSQEAIAADGSTVIKIYYGRNEYTLTYEITGDYFATGSYDTESYEYGAAISALAKPAKDGYTFVGWSGVPATMPAENATASGYYTINQYTITYHLDGGINGEGNPANYTIEDETIILADATKTGYTFNGWYDAETGGSEVTEIAKGSTGDITLYARWTATEYTVTFDTNGGDIPSLASKQVTYDSAYGVLATVTRTGHTFGGWFTAATAGTEVTAETVVKTAGAHTLYAQWGINQYTITFNSDGGSAVAAITQDYGTNVTAPSAPTKTGYTFAGWDNEIPSTMPAENTTITAQWQAVDYDINYNLAGGTNDPNNPDNYTIEDETITLADATKTGYTFDGWYDAATGGNKVTQIAKGSAGDITLYARWTANEYTVTFNAQGGTPDPASQQVTYDATYGTLPVVTKTGHTFQGWYTESTGGTKVEAGTKVKITTGITLYAQWTANSYTVAFDAQGGTPAPESISVTYDEEYETLPEVTKTGYTFQGWYTESTGGTKVEVGTKVKITTGITLYAQWAPNTNTAYKVEHYQQDVSGDGYTLVEDDIENLTGTTDAIATATANEYTGFTLNEDKSTMSAAIKPDGSLVLKLYYDRDIVTIAASPAEEQGTVTGSGGYRYGSGVTVTAKENVGYWFVNWTEDGTEVSLDKHYSFTATTNHSLVANFIPIDYWTYSQTLELMFEFRIGLLPDTPYSQATHFGLRIEGAGTQKKPIDENLREGSIFLEHAPGNFEVWLFSDAEAELPIAIAHCPGQSGDTYGKLVIPEFTVSFDSVHGSPVASIENVLNGATVQEPDQPTKTGYTFGGWYKDEGLNEAWSFATDQVMVNTTLYAKWTANKYEVTLDANGGSVDPASQQVTYDAAYGALPAPIKTGHSFQGWFTAATAGDAVTAETVVETANNHTLYAQWSINQYTISFVTGDGGTQISPITQDYDTAVTPPENPTRLGYTFTSWDKPIPEKMPAEDTTRTAQWQVVQYDISYNLNGGTNHTNNPANYTIEDETITLADATKTGYTFDGWYDAATGGNKVTEIAKGSTGAKTLYARWTANEYTVTFDANGGDDPSPASKVVTYDSTYGDLATVTRTGYTFQGWFTSASEGTRVVSTTAVKITEATTLYAQWKINTYTVSFSAYANGSLAAKVGVAIASGDMVEHFKKVIFTATPATGYQVKEWKVNETAITETGTTHAIESLDAAVTVTVEFEKITYTLTYTAGANGSITGDNPQSVKYEENGAEVEAVPNTGYHFVKWSDDIMTAKRTDTNVKADIAVSATFAINEYTVTFKDHDGTELKKETVEHGTGATAPSAPNRNGYAFAGWDKEFGNVTADLIVTAQYTAIQYTITYNLAEGINNPSNPVSYTIETETILLADATKDGCTFDGWYNEQENQVTEIPKGSTGDIVLTARWSDIALVEFKGLIDESDSRERPEYTREIEEWDTYWTGFEDALSTAQQLYTNLEGTGVLTGVQKDELTTATQGLARTVEILDGIEDFDASFGQRTSPRVALEKYISDKSREGSASSENKPHRMRAYYVQESSDFYWLLSRYQQSQWIYHGIAGTGMNPGLKELIEVDTLVKITSGEYVLQILDEEGNRRPEEDLDADIQPMAISWVKGDTLGDTAILVGKSESFNLVGRTSDGTEYQRSYTFHFLDAGLYLFDPNFEYYVEGQEILRDFRGYDIFNATKQTGYVGDAIQNAINEANPGDTIYVGPGTYTENLTINKRITLIGDPKDGCMPNYGVNDPRLVGIGASAPVLQGSSGTGIQVASGLSNVTILGFEIEGFSTAIDAQGAGMNNFRIEGNYIHGVGNGILGGTTGTQALSDWSVSKNIIEAITTGISLTNIDNLEVDKNQVAATTALELRVSGNHIIENAAVKNNTIIGVANILAQSEPGQAASLKNADIKGNEINGGMYIRALAEGFATVDYLKLENNNIKFADVGISITADAPNDNGDAEITNLTVKDNQLTGNARGLEVSKQGSGYAELRNLNITGNDFTITNPEVSAYAVGLADVGGASEFEDNTVTLSGAASSSYDGVRFSGNATEYWTISGNELYGNGLSNTGSGFRLLNSLNAGAELYLTENRVTGWGKGMYADSLASAVTVELRRNWIYGNSNFGIENGSGAKIDAILNYWGYPSGPYHQSNSYGDGNSISDNVDFAPWHKDDGFATLSDGTVTNTTKGTFYGSIQAAVDDADPGDVIQVEAGVYNEYVIIYRKSSLTLRGDPGNPETVGPGPNAPILDGAGFDSKAGIRIEGSGNVTIEGFEVRNYHGGYNSYGIFGYGDNVSDITVRHNHVHDTGSDGIHAFIYPGRKGPQKNWTVEYNKVESYGGNGGIYFLNTINSTIAHNEIGAPTGTAFAINLRAESTTATYPINMHDVIVSENIIVHPGTAIELFSWDNYDHPQCQCEISDISIVDNTITAGGMAIEAWAGGYGRAELKNFSITGNNITINKTSEGGEAIALNTIDGESTFNGNEVTMSGQSCHGLYIGEGSGKWTVEDNTFLGVGQSIGVIYAGVSETSRLNLNRNLITDWATGVLAIYDNPGQAVLRENHIYGNNAGVVKNSAGSVDAILNYWGNSSGPTHATNPEGLGDSITDGVDYFPWYLDEECTEAVKEGQAAPENLEGIAPTTVNSLDGQITLVTDAMEYRSASAEEWIAVPAEATVITGLAPGSYFVRYKATDTKYASEAAEVIVPVFVPKYTIIFTTTPANAIIVVKDSEGSVVAANPDGTYLIPSGNYSYTATAEGYIDKSAGFTVSDADDTVQVELQPSPVTCVERLISDLPTASSLTLSDLDEVEGAVAAYEALTEEEQSLVDSTLCAKLDAALTKIEGLVLADVDTRFSQAAGELDCEGTGINRVEYEDRVATFFVDNLNSKIEDFLSAGVENLFEELFQDVLAMKLDDEDGWYEIDATEFGPLEAGARIVAEILALEYESLPEIMGELSSAEMGELKGKSISIELKIVPGVREYIGTYQVQFSGVNFNVTLASGTTGVTGAGTYEIGETVTITVIPPTGKEVDSFSVNSIDKKSELVAGVYEFSITENVTVKATYKDQIIPTTISITGSDSIEVKLTGDATETYSATVKDQKGKPIQGAAVTWTLKAAVAGVSINPGTGKVTIADTTVAPSFTIVATSATHSGVIAEKLVSLTKEKNTDATLSDLKIDGVTVPGFTKTKLVYEIELPAGTTAVPTVAATPTDSNAGFSVTQANTLVAPGNESTVTVTAEDGITEQTYTITFSVKANEEQDAPTGLTGIAPTSKANADGKITGVTSAMEYKLSAGASWLTVATNATEITGLPAGTYDVRFAAKTGYNPSPAAQVSVPVYVAPKYSVAFSVTGSNGTLTAKVNGQAIASGAQVEEGETVVFTAAPVTGYKVKEWTLSGQTLVGETGNQYTLADLQSAANVTVEFKVATYTVTFEDWDGTLLDSQEVEHGKSAEAPAPPERIDYTFDGWDKDFSNVTGELTVTAIYVPATVGELNELVIAADGRTRPDYTTAIAEWDSYWNGLQVKLTVAESVYNQLKGKDVLTSEEESQLLVAKAGLQTALEIIDGIEDFDASLGGRVDPQGLVETVYDRSLISDSFQSGRLRCYYDKESSYVYWLLSEFVQGQGFLAGTTGTGMNPGLQNVMSSDSIIRLQSAGKTVEIYHPDGTRKTSKELESEGINLAIHWLYGGGLAKTGTYLDLVDFNIDCQLVGITSDETEFTRTYRFHFVDAGVHLFEKYFQYYVDNERILRDFEGYSIVNATQDKKYAAGPIQTAIDEANPGDKIYVGMGTFNESLTIDKSITLIGSHYSTGDSPYFTVLDGQGLNNGAGIQIAQVVNDVNIYGFEIKNFASGGILAQGAGINGVNIERNYIHDVQGPGILAGVDGASTLSGWTVISNTVETFTGSGISLKNVVDFSVERNAVNSSGGAAIEVIGSASSGAVTVTGVDIKNNDVTGGIRVTAVGTGNGDTTTQYVVIKGNEVAGGAIAVLADADSSASATVKEITIGSNTITGNSAGITLGKQGSGDTSIRYFTIDGNDLVIANPVAAGAAVALADVEGYSDFTNNTVTITGTSGSATIFDGLDISGADTEVWFISNNLLDGGQVGTANSGIRIKGTLPGIAQLNVSGTRVTGWAKGVKADTLDSGVKVEIRRSWIYGNTVGIEDGTGAGLDAILNYWGHTSGPYHATNASGQANSVSNNVSYNPWHQDEGFVSLSGGTVHNETLDRYYQSIQTALDEANPHDTIKVAAGTYNEHLIIEKPVHLIGDIGEENVAGPGPNAPIIDGQAQGSFPVVQIRGTNDVIIEGFEVRNSGRGGIEPHGGPFGDESYVICRYNNIHDVPNGIDLQNAGHYQYDTRGWVISHNVITGYTQFGIFVEGWIKDLEIRDNLIEGNNTAVYVWQLANRQPENISIIDNSLSTNMHAIDVVHEMKDITIIGNDITICNDNPDNWWPSGAAGLGRVSGTGIFSGNKVRGAAGTRGCYYGAWIDGYDLVIGTKWIIEDNEIDGNERVNLYWCSGIFFKVDGADLVVNRNTITGWNTGIELRGNGVTANLKGNCFINNSWGLEVYGCYHDVDAKLNYWGHETGPYPGGLGDTIYYEDNNNEVDYDPWYTDEGCTISSDEGAMNQEHVNTAIAKVPATIASLEVPGGSGASPEAKKAAVKAYIENLDGMAALGVTVTVEAGSSSGYKVTVSKGEATGVKDNVQVTKFIIPPADQAAASIVGGLIAPLPFAEDVNVENYLTYLAAIEEAEAAYNALTESQKTLIGVLSETKIIDLVERIEELVLEELDDRIESAIGVLNYAGTGIDDVQFADSQATLLVSDPDKKVYEFMGSGVLALFESMFQDVAAMKLGDDTTWYAVEGTTQGATEAAAHIVSVLLGLDYQYGQEYGGVISGLAAANLDDLLGKSMSIEVKIQRLAGGKEYLGTYVIEFAKADAGALGASEPDWEEEAATVEGIEATGFSLPMKKETEQPVDAA